MAEHEATPEQWAEVEGYGDPLDPSPIAGCSCLLELRARVEALEAAQPKQITQEELAKLIAQPARVVPLATASAGSLVERVGIAIDSAEYDESEHRWDEARAARRPTPKPPSLKEQALKGLTRIESTNDFFSNQMKDLATIRRALEALPDD